MDFGLGLIVIFGLFVFLFSIASFAFWIWMLIDCVTNEPSEGNDKVIWLLLIIFLGIIGAIVYFFARRSKRIQQYGK
jgi:ABC-type multidrug transport system fused ATPase/permease subunit